MKEIPEEPEFGDDIVSLTQRLSMTGFVKEDLLKRSIWLDNFSYFSIKTYVMGTH